MPMDQHLTLNGVPLSNNDATLITLGIKPGSLLLLQVCLKLSRGEALYHEPLARVIAQALPVFVVKFTFSFFTLLLRQPIPVDVHEQFWRRAACRQSWH